MLDRLSPTVRRWVLALLFALTLWFMWTVRTVLNPILLGYLLAYVLAPLVAKLERRGFKRRTAVGVIFSGFALTMLVGGLMVFAQARTLWTDMSQDGGVIDQIDVRLHNGIEQSSQFLSRFGVDLSAPAEGDQPRGLRELWTQVQHLTSAQDVDMSSAGKAGMKAAGGALTFVRGLFGGLLSLGTLLFLLPIYTYFLLFELDRIHGFVIDLVPKRDRGKLESIAGQIGGVLSNFLRGRVVVSVLKGAFVTVGLALAGVPYALLLGLVAGVLSMVPIIGPLIAFLFGAGLAMLEYDLFTALWRTGLIYLLAEVFEGYVLMPKILGDSLGLHPVVVLASLMIGGAALGMFGILLALPLAATVIILTRELVLPALRKTAMESG
jgi:predicted PurR-regulated permease PerM